MPPEPSLLLAVAETTPQEWLLAFFALASFVLLGFWAIAGQRIRAGVVQGARADYARRLLSRFRLGMESRIGEERSPASVGGGAAEDGQESLLAYASIAEALCGGYAGIFYVDLETGVFAPFRSDGHHARLTELAGQDFFGERVQAAVLAPIHPEDEPALREAFRRERILAATEGGRVFAMPYRYVGRPGGDPVWYEARASRAGGHLVVGVANIDKRMRREKGHEARAEESIARLEELLAQAARSRDTLGRLATYEDAAELRAVALRETGLSLGAVAAYLCRHRLDGTTPIVGSWAVSPERDVLPRDAAQAVGAPDYLDSHPDILYVRGQAEGNDPVWDSMLEKAGATRFLAGLLRVEGEVWGHVAYLVDRPGPIDEEEVEQFREACALVQIGVLRAKLLDARETHREQLVASARAANQAARAKTMFLATMSHEIRTPLNAIIGYSEFLERPGLAPGEIREYTSGIAQSANALLALINDILDLSKLESGRVDMDGRCDLGRLFDELASLFHYRAVTKDLRLGYSIRKDFPVLRLSEEHLRQILLNLVGNAVKFTDSGLVEWRAEAADDGPGTVAVDLSVHDTGIGVSKEKLKTIFDPFVQDGATRGGKVYGGTGLGLPIVKRLLEACHGTIRMESEPGEGTRVYIRIERVPVVPRSERPAVPGADSAGSSALRLPSRFRAVLVDDVPINLRILDLHVRGFGVKDVALAASGEEALRAIAARRPDVVLTDMWMPGMSGADLAAEIRKDHDLDDVPIVAVTADNDVGATFDASLFAEIVTKPVTAEKLRLALMRLFPNAR